MANRTIVLSRDAEIQEVMRTTNLLWVEAAALVARRHGEDVSDIVGIDGPLTAEQKRRLGLGRSLAEFVETEAEETGRTESNSERS
jgi:hypothetical protein